MPTLYVVATPIGNLKDITLRALSILSEVSLIAAEDTRKTRRLLSHYQIKTPMTSYYEYNKLIKLDYILGRLDEADVALVSEAGMPGISDPGYELIAQVGEKGIPVVPVPGASALITALSVSGLPTDRFTYTGFLPRKGSERKRHLESLADEVGTLIFFEAPHRLRASLADILLILGDRRLAICRELTKLHEEVFRGTVREALAHFVQPRGEFTLVLSGAEKKSVPRFDDVQQKLRELRLKGFTAKTALAQLTGESGISRKELYRLWLGLEKSE
ncbi:MAG: 16S rRNA (cytidine(1402)-2'-O)-methyltransferase [Chloroflexota bacterium]